MPDAIVMSFGDEMTSGQRVDTNSAWLSARLAAIGIPTSMHLTAGDDLESAVAALRFAGARAAIIVMTGGLGPTKDDLTREAMARAADTTLELDEAALAHIECLFKKYGRKMPERNRVQAMFPMGSQAIPNPHGSAPGVDLATNIEGNAARYFALPGVPAEMKEMWAETVERRLLECGLGGALIRSYTLKCFGEGESATEQRLGDLMRRDADPLVGITVHQATITLRILAKGQSEEECDAKAKATSAQIREILGELVFGEGDDQLEDAVTRALDDGVHSLATLECDKQGLLVRWLTSAAAVHDSSSYRGGIVCDDASALAELIDVDRDECPDPSSAEFCKTAAESVRKQFGTSHALVVGGIPREIPVERRPKVNAAIADATGVTEFRIPYGGHPDVRGPRLIKGALNKLRLMIRQNG